MTWGGEIASFWETLSLVKITGKSHGHNEKELVEVCKIKSVIFCKLIDPQF